MNNKDWQPHEDVSRTEYVVGLERKVKELETEQHHKVKEALANSDACWRMEQEVFIRQRDEVASRARRACQILIEEIGADGPTDVDAVKEQENLRADNVKLREENARLRAALRGLFKPDGVPYAQWTREMHAAHVALESER
jgi:hypothetical protein